MEIMLNPGQIDHWPLLGGNKSLLCRDGFILRRLIELRKAEEVKVEGDIVIIHLQLINAKRVLF